MDLLLFYCLNQLHDKQMLFFILLFLSIFLLIITISDTEFKDKELKNKVNKYLILISVSMFFLIYFAPSAEMLEFLKTHIN